MKRLLLTLLVLVPQLAWGQGAVQQQGPVTPGHTPVWVRDHLIGDGGPAGSGTFTELGITAAGSPLCINDGPTSGPYHQLCLGANDQGGGLLSYNAFNGAAPFNMNCYINGILTTSCLPPAGGGGGPLAPPVTLTGNITTPVTQDTGLFTLLSQGGANTPVNIVPWVVCPASCSNFNIDGIRSVFTATNNSTAPSAAIDAYIVNDNAKGASPLGSGIGLSTVGIGDVDNSSTWGILTLLTDHKYQVSSTGSGRKLYNELDFNVTSANTGGAGLRLGGTWQVANSNISGLAVNAPNGPTGGVPSAPFPQWACALCLGNGAAGYGLEIGTAHYTKTTGDASMPIYWGYVDQDGNYQGMYLTANPYGGGLLELTGTGSWALGVQGGGGPLGLTLGPESATAVANGQSKSLELQYWDPSSAIQNFQFVAGLSNTLTISNTASSGFVNVPDLVIAPGGNANGVNISQIGTGGSSVPSKNLLFDFTDGTGVTQNYSIQATGGSALNISSTVTNPLLTIPNIVIQYGVGSTSGITIGATAASGVNIPSKYLSFAYFDASGNNGSWNISANSGQFLDITGTAGPGQAKFNVDGQYYINGVQGASCAGAPDSNFAVENGIVTRC